MVKTAIILCGGQSKRLRPLTDNIPKALVEVNGKPLIEYIFDNLAKHKVEKVILACGYKWEKIKEKYGDEFKGIKLEYSVETEFLGTAGAVKKAMSLVDEDMFFVLNGDIISDLNLEELRKVGSNTISVSRFHSRFGLVDVEKGKVKGFREKPLLPFWANAGAYLLNKNICLPDKGSVEHDVFPKTELKAFKHSGLWIPIDTIKQIEEAEKELKGIL